MRALLDRAFAAAYDPVLRGAERAGLARIRDELLADLEGHVVELGAGTGANLDHLGPRIERLTALEPSPAMAARLRVHAARGSDHDVEVIEAPAEALPIPTASVDTVVATLVLCTVADPTQTLREIRRVLRPGGQLVLLEHVRGQGATEAVQRALDPVWHVVGRGCHLTRDTRRLVEEAGFDTSELRDVRLPLPGPVRPGLVGIARRCAAPSAAG
jgi:ubiquinone/menaquinone biosynthesis C-methylase UbiE